MTGELSHPPAGLEPGGGSGGAGTDSLQLLIERLHARGERLTIQRRLVLEVLQTNKGHMTVEDIRERLAARGMALDAATVYRIVQWLKDVEIVAQTDLGRGSTVYELIGGERHHHLVCLNCGSITDLDDGVFEPLREFLRRRYGFAPRIDHMAIFGQCRLCREEEAEAN
jgi:Fur family ferric uptake transcriptional regulator